MLKCRKRQINNLKENIQSKRPNDRTKCATEKVELWDLILLIYWVVVPLIYTVAPYIKEHSFAQTDPKQILIVYLVVTAVFILFAIWAFVRKGNYKIIQKEFAEDDRVKEIEKIRNKEYEKELSEQLTSFASIGLEI